MQILPRPFGQVIATAVNSLGRVWRPVVSTSLMVFIPIGALTLLVFNISGAIEFLDAALNDPASLEGLSRDALLDAGRPFLRAVGIAIAIQAIGTIYVYLASHRLIAADLSGYPISGAQARRDAASRFLIGLVAGIIVVAVIAVALFIGLGVWLVPFLVVGTPNPATVLVALILLVAVAAPAIWLSVSFSMVTSVVAIEGRGVLGALRRSLRLVRRRWWATLGYLLLVGLIGSVAAQLIQVLAIPLTVIGDTASGLTLASLFGMAFQGVIIAGIGAMYTVWYVDLRARFEELDADDLRFH